MHPPLPSLELASSDRPLNSPWPVPPIEEPKRPSKIITLKYRQSMPHCPPEPLLVNASRNSPAFNTPTWDPKRFDSNGKRKYLNIRPAGGQPFPLKKRVRYLAKDYKDGVRVAASSVTTDSEQRSEKAKEEEIANDRGSDSSSGLSSIDSSPERPLAEIARLMKARMGSSGLCGEGRRWRMERCGAARSRRTRDGRN